MRLETKTRAIGAVVVIFGLTAGILCGNTLVKTLLEPDPPAMVPSQKTLFEEVKRYLQSNVQLTPSSHAVMIEAITDGIDHARQTPSQKLRASGFDFCG